MQWYFTMDMVNHYWLNLIFMFTFKVSSIHNVSVPTMVVYLPGLLYLNRKIHSPVSLSQDNQMVLENVHTCWKTCCRKSFQNLPQINVTVPWCINEFLNAFWNMIAGMSLRQTKICTLPSISQSSIERTVTMTNLYLTSLYHFVISDVGTCETF